MEDSNPLSVEVYVQEGSAWQEGSIIDITGEDPVEWVVVKLL